MEEVELDLAHPRVPVSTVLASIAGLWACYFALTTIRAEILDLGFEFELLWRRVLVAIIGVAVTFAMWLILRLFDLRPLWIKVAAALVIAAPVSIVLAQANALVFADIEPKVVERRGEQQGQGVKFRRDESGNLLVDVPAPHAPEPPPAAPAAPAEDAVPADDMPQTAEVTSAENQVQQLTEVALGRYFLMLAWCALYLALVAGEQARTAERREGAFRRAAKAAELRSLRYQVNPHFLFNTLNSLSALVLTGRTQQAETMIQTISTFYRRSLADDPTSDVLLGEELALQRLYLDVEAVRFPERLVAVYELPEELGSAKVPGMILQPLVENSVKHAVAPSSGKITITLAAREEYGRLVITVSDDGGSAGGKRKSGTQPLTRGHGIGLQNVRERLEARFGEQASIVSGPSGSGYATLIRIPLVLGPSMADEPSAPLRTLIVDDEPLAVERMQVICAELDHLAVVGTASDGGAALRLVDALSPDLLLLDMTMPEMDGLQVARALGGRDARPAVIFVTAHDDFAVEAFDLEAVDYVLKPVTPERLQRAIGRAVARRGSGPVPAGEWLAEFWVPHRSELIRIEAAQVERIDAERDYVRLHVGGASYLLLQTIAGLEARLNPTEFIRIHRSCILRRDGIRGLRHEGLGVWSVEIEGGDALRIGRTYLARVKAMAGR